jgi:hypothetical protein
LKKRPGHRSVDNIKMHLAEIGWWGIGWIGLAQDRNKWRSLMNGNEAVGSIKCWEVVK